MVRRKEEEKFLNVDATMQGSLVFSDPVNLRINGKFEGSLKTRGNLIIGENARVTADIEGENIIISGFVKGKIKSTQLVGLTSTANVYGEIETPHFSVEEGAIFNGRCRMPSDKLSLSEVSNFLSVEEATIMEWVNTGKIPVEKEGGELFFDRKQVEAWIAQQNR